MTYESQKEDLTACCSSSKHSGCSYSSVKSHGPGLALFQAALALVRIDSPLHCRSFARHQLKTQPSPLQFLPSHRYPRRADTHSQPFCERNKRLTENRPSRNTNLFPFSQPLRPDFVFSLSRAPRTCPILLATLATYRKGSPLLNPSLST